MSQGGAHHHREEPMKRRTSRVAEGRGGSIPHASKKSGPAAAADRERRVILYRQALDDLSKQATTYIDRFYRSPAPYVVLDQHNRIKDCNRALADLLGRFPSQLRNVPIADHIEQPFRSLFLSTIRRAWENNTRPQCSIMLAGGNGSTLHAHVFACASGGDKDGVMERECRIILSEIADPSKEKRPGNMPDSYDYLTGALNRSAGLMALEYLIAESHKEKKPLSICLIDLSNLKKINGQYGTLEGDEAIVMTAKIITRNIKKSDVVCRLASHSFLVIFRRCTFELAEMVMTRIAAELAKHNDDRGKPYNISWRFDIEEWNEEADATIEELLKKADQRLHLQKTPGGENAPHGEEYDAGTPLDSIR
jgi:diguanylate cyclase (GGDEF)-like protein